MAGVTLDAGALIAASRDDHRFWVWWKWWTLRGKPCIRGLRITVYDVLDYLAGGMSFEALLEDFPELARDDLRSGPRLRGTPRAAPRGDLGGLTLHSPVNSAARAGSDR